LAFRLEEIPDEILPEPEMNLERLELLPWEE